MAWLVQSITPLTRASVFGGIRSQTGATSALAFTGELYNPQTQLLHLRARDYAVTLGRLFSADTVGPNAEVGQRYNFYAFHTVPTDVGEHIERI